MIRLRLSGADEVLIKRVRDWYEPGPGVFIAPQALFNPALLFTTGVNGTWYDPSDLNTLFQDAAGTTPVTAVEQPVGLMLDKSGRGNHAFNPSGNSANFPMLKQDEAGRKYLNFNGTNQWLQTNSIDFTYGDKMFVCAGVRKLSDAARGMLLELSAAGSTSMFNVEAPDAAAAATYKFRSSGTAIRDVIGSGFPSPTTNVVSGIGDISAPSAILRVNGVQSAQTTSSQGTGNYGNFPLYIGARAGTSLWFNGRLHQLVVAGKAASAAEISSTESYINQRTGAY